VSLKSSLLDLNHNTNIARYGIMTALIMISSLCLLVGLLGSLSGSLILPIIIRRLGRQTKAQSRITSTRNRKPITVQPFSSVAILIPLPSCNSNERELEASISSIVTAIAQLRRSQPAFSAEVLIGSPEPIPEQFSGNNFGFRWIVTGQGNRGAILRELIERAWAYDWIAIVEPGTEWAPGVLAAAYDAAIQDPETVLISPNHGHRDPLSALASSSISLIKRLFVHPPHLCGIPMPFRPATTFYRSDELIATFRELRSLKGGLRGLVIPMVMRALHPTARFVGLAPVRSSSVVASKGGVYRPDSSSTRLPDAVICFQVVRSLSIRPPISLAVTVIQYLIVSGWVYWSCASLFSAALLLGPLSGTISLGTLSVLVGIVAGIVALAERADFSGIFEEITNSLRVPLMIVSPPEYYGLFIQDRSRERGVKSRTGG
jgi:hypothetical protein